MTVSKGQGLIQYLKLITLSTLSIDMGQKTALGTLLKSIGNNGQGKVVPGWGAVPVMAFVGVLLLVFLVIMLQIYNQSLLLQGFSVNWNGVG